MAKVICFFSRKKWRGPKTSQVSAHVGRLAAKHGDEAAYVTRRLGDWENIGLVSARVVRRIDVR